MSATTPVGSIDVSHDVDGIVVSVHGELDSDVARLVYEAVESAIVSGAATSVEVDLREMDEWTASGLADLGACAALGTRFRMGPHATHAS